MMVIDGQPWRYWGKWWSSTGSPHFWTSTSMTLPLRFLKWGQVKTYHYYNWRKPHPLASYFRVLTHDQVKNNSTYSKICSSGERERRYAAHWGWSRLQVQVCVSGIHYARYNVPILLQRNPPAQQKQHILPRDSIPANLGGLENLKDPRCIWWWKVV